jgi:hypothetical protein
MVGWDTLLFYLVLDTVFWFKIGGVMNWFQAHSYLAPWLAPLVAIAIAIIQNRKNLLNFAWPIFTVYLTFFTLTGVMISSSFSEQTKSRLQFVWMMSFLIIVWDFLPPLLKRQQPVDKNTAKSETPIKPPH